MTPIVIIGLGVIFALLTLLVVFFEISLFLDLSTSSIYNDWVGYE